MSWVVTCVIALLTGLFGLVCGGVVAAICTKWYNVSDAAGQGYVVVFTAFLTGIASGIIGIVVARITAAGPDPGFFKGLGYASGSVFLLSILAVMICRWQAHVPPEIAGRRLMLEVELRLPAADAVPPAERDGEPSFTLGSVIRHVQRKARRGEVHLDRVRQEEGRWIVPASVFLFTGRGLRSIGLELGGRTAGGFIVPLPGRPGRRHEQWSDWAPRGRPGRPWPDTEPSYRFRVARIGSETTSA